MQQIQENSLPLKQWAAQASLTQLIEHLCSEHARWRTNEFPQLEDLFYRASAGPEPENPLLAPLADGFIRLREDLNKHFDGEETVLFPAAIALENAAQTNTSIARPTFGSVLNPVALLGSDHSKEMELIENVRSACQGYRLDENEPTVLKQLYVGMQTLERALHQHRELEDRILFPRIVALESAANRYRSA